MSGSMFVSLKDKLKKAEATPEHLGGKGAGLYWMSSKGFPVPHAVILPTTVCAAYQKDPESVMAAIKAELPAIKEQFIAEFGYLPLLSVRSGARVSMPGMMDTILNVGLDNNTYDEWTARLGDACVYNSACRLIEMYGSVVDGIDRHSFGDLDMAEAMTHRADVYEKATGKEFPDCDDQIIGAIGAVFKSWDNERAKIYRELNDIPEDWGTAVVVQAMVFGNLNDQSCTGVLFTRNPDSGESGVLGEYLINAQGEDVVAGIRTPDPISEMQGWNQKVHSELMQRVALLEESKQDVQDVEFTVMDGKLYILQTRNAKRSARAAVRLAVDFYMEGGLDLKTVLKRVTPKQYDLAQQAILDPTYIQVPDFTGIPACSGVVTGVVMTSSEAAINCKAPCILVTAETTPDDIGGMNAAKAVLTMTGGATSHAAVVARGMNKPCVVGLGVDITKFPAGTTISIDGATGRVWMHAVPVIDGSADPYIQKFKDLMWAAIDCKPIAARPTAHSSMILRKPELLFMPPAVAYVEVADALKTCDTLILDLSGVLEDHEFCFFRPFIEEELEGQRLNLLLSVLEAKLTEKQKGALTVLTAGNTALKTVPSALNLEQLVLAESDMVWAGSETPAVKKVLEWKLSQGIKLLSFGVMTPGGYVSERQLIAEVLG